MKENEKVVLLKASVILVCLKKWIKIIKDEIQACKLKYLRYKILNLNNYLNLDITKTFLLGNIQTDLR